VVVVAEDRAAVESGSEGGVVVAGSHLYKTHLFICLYHSLDCGPCRKRP